MAGFRIVAAALGGLALAACAADPFAGPKQSTATTAGAGAYADAPTGTITGGRVTGPAGGATGGIAANSFAAPLDERDRDAAAGAQLRALQTGEPGVPVAWHSQQTGHRGTIVPGPAYQSNGMTCREFSHTVYIDGRPQTGRAAACRNPDGTWTPAS
jgi:surface antigen